MGDSAAARTTILVEGHRSSIVRPRSRNDQLWWIVIAPNPRIAAATCWPRLRLDRTGHRDMVWQRSQAVQYVAITARGEVTMPMVLGRRQLSLPLLRDILPREGAARLSSKPSRALAASSTARPPIDISTVRDRS